LQMMSRMIGDQELDDYETRVKQGFSDDPPPTDTMDI
jgi:hypothetical protein